MVPPWKYRTWVADLWDFRNISSQMNVAWKKVKLQPIAKMVGVWAFYSRKKLGEYWWSLLVGGYHPFCYLQSFSGHLSKSQIVCHWLTSSPSTYHPKIPVICGYVWKKNHTGHRFPATFRSFQGGGPPWKLLDFGKRPGNQKKKTGKGQEETHHSTSHPIFQVWHGTFSPAGRWIGGFWNRFLGGWGWGLWHKFSQCLFRKFSLCSWGII